MYNIIIIFQIRIIFFSLVVRDVKEYKVDLFVVGGVFIVVQFFNGVIVMFYIFVFVDLKFVVVISKVFIDVEFGQMEVYF